MLLLWIGLVILKRFKSRLKKGASSEEVEEYLSIENKYASQANEEQLPEQLDTLAAAKLQRAQNNDTLKMLKAARGKNSLVNKAGKKLNNLRKATGRVVKDELKSFGSGLLGPASFVLPMASSVLSTSLKAMAHPVATFNSAKEKVQKIGRNLNPKNWFSKSKTEEEKELEKQNKALDKIIKALKKSEYQSASDEKRAQNNTDLLTQLAGWAGNFVPMLQGALGIASLLMIGQVITKFFDDHATEFGQLTSEEQKNNPDVINRMQDPLLSQKDVENNEAYFSGLSDEDYKQVTGHERTWANKFSSGLLRTGLVLEESLGVKRATGNIVHDLLTGDAGKPLVVNARAMQNAKNPQEARLAAAASANETVQSTGTSISPNLFPVGRFWDKEAQKYEKEALQRKTIGSTLQGKVWNPTTGQLEDRKSAVLPQNPKDVLFPNQKSWGGIDPSKLVPQMSPTPVSNKTVVNQINNNFTLPKSGIGNSGVQ